METPVPNFYFMGVQFFHLLALVIWVGGMVVIRCIVVPILLHLSPSQQGRNLALREIFKRFYRITLVCAGVLVVTSVIKFLTWENLTPWNTMRYSAIFGMCWISLYVNSGILSRRAQSKTSIPTSLPEDTTQSESRDLNRLSARADRLMMGSLVCGVTAILMA